LAPPGSPEKEIPTSRLRKTCRGLFLPDGPPTSIERIADPDVSPYCSGATVPEFRQAWHARHINAIACGKALQRQHAGRTTHRADLDFPLFCRSLRVSPCSAAWPRIGLPAAGADLHSASPHRPRSLSVVGRLDWLRKLSLPRSDQGITSLRSHHQAYRTLPVPA
jgi:hypothetical protein